jgi:hypothetical protein
MTQDTQKMLWALFFAVQLAIGACGQESSTAETQVLVTVDSDLRADVSKVEVQVLDVRAEVAGSTHLFEIAGDDSWPISFAVAPTRGKEGGSFLVTARGLDAKSELLSESKGILTFVKGKTTTAALWLLNVCRGVTCAGLQTCIGRGAQAGMCDAVPVLDTEVAEPGSQSTSHGGTPPRLMPPAAGTSTESGSATTDGDGGAMRDGSVRTSTVDGGPQVIVPRVENVPTLSGFSTLAEPRSTAGGLLLLDDGFELDARSCNAAGCATASFSP